MLDAAQRAIAIGEIAPSDGLDPNDVHSLAIVRLLEILGEAAARVGEDTRQRDPAIPWRQIADTRNRLIHGYFDVDMGLVRTIVAIELPNLVTRLSQILDDLARE